MKRIEVSAKTVEEAIEQGLEQLGLAIGDVEVQVVEEGSKGLFGLFGSRLGEELNEAVLISIGEDPLVSGNIGNRRNLIVGAAGVVFVILQGQGQAVLEGGCCIGTVCCHGNHAGVSRGHTEMGALMWGCGS